MIHRLIWGVLPLAALLSLGCASGPKADLIVHNGKIVTVDPEFRITEAMAVKGERIVATGSNSEVLKLAKPDTLRIDLQGKTVLPGLMDSHLHVVMSAMYELDHTVPECHQCPREATAGAHTNSGGRHRTRRQGSREGYSQNIQEKQQQIHAAIRHSPMILTRTRLLRLPSNSP